MFGHTKWKGIVVLMTMMVVGVVIMNIFNNSVTYNVTQTQKPLSNPLKGWVCWADDKNVKQEVTLSFALIKWSDIESEKGIYNFDYIEETNNFNYWKEKDVKMILRLVSDYPSKKDSENITIPSWLYEEMDGDGQKYDTSYGYGFSPNYKNPIFMEAHSNLLAAMGERYNEDSSIAYVQLGSVGHWGEWHVKSGEGIDAFPKSAVTDVYVNDYIEHFSNINLMMRRPYEIAKANGFGLFNDAFGNEKATSTWLSWIKDGYLSDQSNEQQPSMDGFWRGAPVGGEIASNEKLEYYMGENFDKTYQQALDSHISFIGPNSPVWVSKEDDLNDNVSKLSRDMGYCYTVHKVKIYNIKDTTKDLELKMNWSNSGIAPIYQNWPVKVMLFDELGNTCSESILDADLTKWVSGEYVDGVTLPDTKNLEKGKYTVGVAILDPETGEPAIRMPIKNEYKEKVYIVGKFAR